MTQYLLNSFCSHKDLSPLSSLLPVWFSGKILALRNIIWFLSRMRKYTLRKRTTVKEPCVFTCLHSVFLVKIRTSRNALVTCASVFLGV